MTIFTHKLFTERGADYTGDTFKIEVQGLLTVQAFGDFSGTTVKLQATLDGEHWFDVEGASFTAPGGTTTTLLASAVRGVTEGGESPSVTFVISYVR